MADERSREALLAEILELRDELKDLRELAHRGETTAERLREAMDSSSDMVVLYDKEERIVFTNDRYHEIYPNSPPKHEIVDYSQEQLLRRSLDAGLIDHPLARKDPDAWIEMRLQQRRHAIGGVTEAPHTNGRIYQVRHRRTNEGGVLIVQSDITDFKRVEALHRGRSLALEALVSDEPLEDVFRILLTSMEEARSGFASAVYMFNERSRQLEQFVAPNIPDGLTGLDLASTFPLAEVDDFGALDQVFVAADEFDGQDWREVRHILEEAGINAFSIFPIRDTEQQKVGLLVLFYRGGSDFVTRQDDLAEQTLRLMTISLDRRNTIDALERARVNLETRVAVRTKQLRQSEARAVKMAEEAEQARDAAESANRVKSEFLASMSHEIRTPMTGVIGFADMLLDDELPEDSREKVFKIKDATRALLSIINDILDISKMEAGKLEIAASDTRIADVVDDVTELFSGALAEEQSPAIKLTAEIADGTPESIRVDATRLRQILVNLVGNAVKFTDQGQVSVLVSVDRSDDKTGAIRFAVRDTGIGIPKESMGKLFAEFSQADASITRDFGGTGLGLAICKRLTDLMGGEIGVESEIGVGSTFWFTLPYIASFENVQEPAGPLVDWSNFSTERSLRILVAEDTEMNQRIIQATLNAIGHESRIAENGREAVRAHRSDDYDLILMDVRMPEVSGLEATRIIRAEVGQKAEIPIIALTADAMAEHVRAYLEAGMNQCVCKPIDRSELAKAINEVLGEQIHKPC